MKRFLKLMAVAALAVFTVASCYDDTALKASIKELQDQMKEANTLLEKVKNGFVITSATKTDDGYTFTMSDGKTISVKNGVNGTDGTDGVDGVDGTPATVIETKLEKEVQVFGFGEQKTIPINVTGVSIIDAFAPVGWAASVDAGSLYVTAPKSPSGAARKGSVLVVATGGNSLVIMSAAVALNILDVNGAYWDALIDDPQYGGDLLYGPMDEYYCYNVDYFWEDPVTKFAFKGFGSNWGSVCFSSGGEVISNYVVPEYKGADYLRQLEVPVAPASGNNFIVHYGGEDSQTSLVFADGQGRFIESLECTMTSYLASSAIFGDGFFGPLEGKSFVGVKAIGYDADGKETATVSKVLVTGDDVVAYQKGDKEIEWSTWDLSGLGKVVSVKFAVYGSEDCYGEWGFNAPAYFAYCDVVVKE
jgi:hypothetical protein